MIKGLARLILRIGGWTPATEMPDLDKAVFIAAPHTSNWDGIWLIIYRIGYDIDVHFLAKDTLFWWPLGPILRAVGAIPIDRKPGSPVVQQIVDEFERRDRFWFALSPEGTRKWQPYWKTGFYRIALAADVPIATGFIDYKTRSLGVGIALPPERDLEKDLEFLREYFAPFVGRNPENTGPVEFPPDFKP